MSLGTNCFLRMAGSIRWAFNWKEWNPSKEEFMETISCLQIEEKERLGRFVFRKDVRSSLIGRLMMRKFVSEYGHIPYNNIKFSRDKNNKPILENSTLPISFNVSHQGNYTVLAGEVNDVKLGIDVMRFEYTGGKPISEFFRLMSSNFTPLEWKQIRGTKTTSEKKQLAVFCRIWALKESFVKALGVGIIMDLKEIEFTLNSELSSDSVVNDTLLHVGGVRQNWMFEESMIDNDHCVAVAMQQNCEAVVSKYVMFETLTYTSLMEKAIPLFPHDSGYMNTYFDKEETPWGL